ncbi:MAG: lactonase family protein [Lachnospiraceae bacterium]|nr:lactonase family protein [Lachnospiraceae bacterium]
MSKEKYVAYVGTYTHEHSVGIYVYDIDPENGVLTERSVARVNNPSYLCVSKDGQMLYSIADEGVASFSIDKNGDLTKVNQEWNGGMRGCYVVVDSQRRYLFVGGFHDGRVTMMKLAEDGSIAGIADGIFHQGVGLSASNRRLDHPKVSCVQLTPDERFLCAADYGLNQIKVYKIDYERGKLKLEDIVRCSMDSGPRSVRFSQDGKNMYVLTELANAVEVYNYYVKNDEPEFDKIQELPVWESRIAAAASCMAFTDDDRYLYVSVDGINEVMVLKRDTADGTLSIEQSVPCSGDFPKSLAPLPGDNYYVVLNHDTDEMTTFKVDHEKGYALMSNSPIPVDSPNVIRLHKLK